MKTLLELEKKRLMLNEAREALRMLEGADADSPLFVDYFRYGFNRICDKTVYRIFKRICKSNDIEAAPHAARAAFATRLLDQGKSYEQVARALRHGDLQSVPTYDKRRLEISSNVGKDVQY